MRGHCVGFEKFLKELETATFFGVRNESGGNPDYWMCEFTDEYIFDQSEPRGGLRDVLCGHQDVDEVFAAITERQWEVVKSVVRARMRARKTRVLD